MRDMFKFGNGTRWAAPRLGVKWVLLSTANWRVTYPAGPYLYLTMAPDWLSVASKKTAMAIGMDTSVFTNGMPPPTLGCSLAKILRVTWLRITSAHPCLSQLMALTSRSAQVSTTVARAKTRYPASDMSRSISTTKPQRLGNSSARTLTARRRMTNLELRFPYLRMEPGWPSVHPVTTTVQH